MMSLKRVRQDCWARFVVWIFGCAINLCYCAMFCAIF
nr:MAG TPA: hypothetical protein [Caudoviricetes sp.]DAI31869.1 MAG TPA: hypothetical protein [Caudoviricetes sp.]